MYTRWINGLARRLQPSGSTRGRRARAQRWGLGIVLVLTLATALYLTALSGFYAVQY